MLRQAPQSASLLRAALFFAGPVDGQRCIPALQAEILIAMSRATVDLGVARRLRENCGQRSQYGITPMPVQQHASLR